MKKRYVTLLSTIMLLFANVAIAAPTDYRADHGARYGESWLLVIGLFLLNVIGYAAWKSVTSRSEDA